MDRKHLNALALGNLERFHHVDTFVVPANAALERKRNLGCGRLQRLFHLVQNLLQTRQVPQKSGTAPLARHLRRRTSRIHFDKFRAVCFRNFTCGSCHAVREPSKNLNAERALFREKPELLVSIRVKHGIAIRRHKLRNQKPHAVARKHAAQTPERRIGHSVHRTQDCVGKNLLISERKTDPLGQTFNFQHLNNNYPQIFRNVNPKKIFNFELTITLSSC